MLQHIKNSGFVYNVKLTIREDTNTNNGDCTSTIQRNVDGLAVNLSYSLELSVFILVELHDNVENGP